ncbi:MAG: hypothetical protein RMI04_02365 [Thermofilaceae archaeon]|nr:hypothetical protein [Thermofilaceae archaeon]
MTSLVYKELLDLLKEELKNNKEVYELIESLVNIFSEEGAKGVRHYLARLIREVLDDVNKA